MGLLGKLLGWDLVDARARTDPEHENGRWRREREDPETCQHRHRYYRDGIIYCTACGEGIEAL